MISKISIGRFVALCLTLAFLGGSAQLITPRTQAQEVPVGHLTVTGQVRVNGQPAATGDIVSSGSTVETAKGSSAVVSLGKLGRVEALPETRMILRYDDSKIAIKLEMGSVRVSTGPGVAATVNKE